MRTIWFSWMNTSSYYYCSSLRLTKLEHRNVYSCRCSSKNAKSQWLYKLHHLRIGIGHSICYINFLPFHKSQIKTQSWRSLILLIKDYVITALLPDPIDSYIRSHASLIKAAMFAEIANIYLYCLCSLRNHAEMIPTMTATRVWITSHIAIILVWTNLECEIQVPWLEIRIKLYKVFLCLWSIDK